MRKITLFAFGVLASAASYAQLTTPGTGQNYDLTTLSALDPSILTFDGTKYILSDDLIISTTDVLEITTSDTLFVDSDKRITIEGSLVIDAGQNNPKFVLSSTDTLNPAEGIRFEEFSIGSIKNSEITYTGGLRVLTEDFEIEDSYLAHNVSGVSTGAVISLSRGAAVIKNNTFYMNDLPAVGSGANQNVAAQIINNWIEKNCQSNQNRPQINVGPTGTDTLRIIGNTILGDRAMTMAGGIGVSNFVGADINAIIEANVIIDNRYGLSVLGANANVLIKDNIIEDNDSQNDPNLGGSGISLNSSDDSQNIIIRENKIRGNIWGITVIGQASADLGTTGDLGNNLFSDNGNNGEIFAIYNNTPLDISAMGNCWIESNQAADSTEIEDVVFHNVDDVTLGTVDFSNWSCGILSTDKFKLENINLYPNPAQNRINITNDSNFETVEFFNISGKLLKTEKLIDGENKIDLSFPNGLYLLKFTNKENSLTKKLMIK
ncbi:T9SS type A sorting domain-containing protein [Brumimicrobium mesophilum]|uniref:T9SS type A sorting domain-containing protein n=1 Tax=Brumimicrobium mesophilum TaxID=392717 RepID=UPI000D143161|nr:T9SS type A sorting domain-containing protein [Brumimicrobium mesophilum]